MIGCYAGRQDLNHITARIVDQGTLVGAQCDIGDFVKLKIEDNTLVDSKQTCKTCILNTNKCITLSIFVVRKDSTNS